MTEPNTAQSIVDGQLAELQITSAEVTGDTYKEQHDAKIAALDAEEAALPVPKDKASLQVVQDFITKSEKARTGIDKWRKAFKDQWKRIIDPVDAYIGTNKENGMQARIYAIQERAEAKKKAYLDEQAKAQREAERLLEERYNDRVGKLMAIGMAFEPNGNLTIRHGEETATATKEQIRFATDEQMAGAVQRAEIIAERIADAAEAARQAKEAQEREEAEERERLRVQKEEQDAAAAKLKEEREALDRGREDMADHRAGTRGADLVVLGATAHGYGPAAMRYEISDVVVGHGELRHMDNETWIATRERVRDAKVKAIEEQREHMRKQELAEARVKELQALGAEEFPEGIWHLGVVEGDPMVLIGQLRTMTSDEWAPVLARFKEAAERTKQAESLTEVMAAPDKAANALTLERFEASADGHDPHEQADFLPVIGSQPLPEGSAVVGSQPDLMTEEDAPVLREAEKWGTGRLAYLAGYEAGYKACEAEVTEMNDGE